MRKTPVSQAAASLKAATALLRKYSVKAQVEGVVLAVNVTPGGYVSSQGAYNAFTQGFDPLVVMSTPQDYLGVRCYIDEILVSRLPSQKQITAQMSIKGTDIKIPSGIRPGAAVCFAQDRAVEPAPGAS
jgi:HlyD family secretion protein